VVITDCWTICSKAAIHFLLFWPFKTLGGNCLIKFNTCDYKSDAGLKYFAGRRMFLLAKCTWHCLYSLADKQIGILRSNVHFMFLPVVSCRLVRNTIATLVESLYKITVDVCESNAYVLWILEKCLCLP